MQCCLFPSYPLARIPKEDSRRGAAIIIDRDADEVKASQGIVPRNLVVQSSSCNHDRVSGVCIRSFRSNDISH